jgi:Putative MetA-pathway of phenol degradation
MPHSIFGRAARPLTIAAAAALFVPGLAFAHHPGATGNIGGAGPINTIPAATLPQGVTAVAVTYEYTKLGGLNDAALVEAAEADQHAHSIGTIASPAAAIAYGLTNDFSVSMRLPYVTRSDIREGEHHHDDVPDEHGAEVARRGNSNGIGDVSLLGQWRLLNNQTSETSASLLLGVKAPTGKTGQIDDNGERFEAEFQAGTGSWDGMFGLAITQRLGAWSVDGNVLYTTVGEGVLSTDLGDRFHYNAAVSYRILGGLLESRAMYSGAHHHDHDGHNASHTHAEAPDSPAIDLVFELNGEWHDRQRVADVADANSGGNVVYIAPGARLSIGNWSGFVSVGVPVINNLNGLQSEPDVRVTSGVGVSF